MPTRPRAAPADATPVQPLYGSAACSRPCVARPHRTGGDDAFFLYLAGRPVAQLTTDGSGAETWTYLTPYLGTPLLATDDAGAVVWQGGFEPFGTDWQANTTVGALDSGIYLRSPGQWEDQTWSAAASGVGTYYNVYRTYSHQVGRYLRPDPWGILPPERDAANFYLYGHANPLRFMDLVGLDALTQDSGVQDCMYCIFWRSGQGLRDIEEGMWVTCSGGQFHCELWPSTERRGNSRKVTTTSSPRPPDACAIVHTHPRRRPARPSTCKQPNCDVIVAKRQRLPIYTVHPSGVWKYDPDTDQVTRELGSDWFQDPEKRCKKPCKGLN